MMANYTDNHLLSTDFRAGKLESDTDRLLFRQEEVLAGA